MKGKMQEVGFEPTPPKRLVPETSALDHSATLASINRVKIHDTVKGKCEKDGNKANKEKR